MYDVHTILRILVFATFCLAALVALAGWLVRTRRVSPFGGLGRTLRSVTDPVLRPVERRLVRLGGNPVHAGWWLVVVVAAGAAPPVFRFLLDLHPPGGVARVDAYAPPRAGLPLLPRRHSVPVAALFARAVARAVG